MSGHKRVNFKLQKEVQARIDNAEKFLRSLQESTNLTNQSSKNFCGDFFEDILLKLENRQNESMESINDINNQLYQLENQRVEEYKQQHDSMYSNVTDITENILRRVSDLSTEVQEVNERQNERQEIFENIIADLHSNILNKQTNDEILQKMVESLIEQSWKIINFITWEYPIGLPSSIFINQFQNEIKQAENDLISGFLEIAFLNARKCHSELSDLCTNLEKESQEFTFLYLANCESIKTLIQKAESNRSIPAMDLEGNILNIDLDVDYWTDRSLSKFIRKLSHLLDRLQDSRHKISLPKMLELNNHWIPNFEHTLGQIILQARTKLIYSQLRVNIADQLIKALSSQGYTPISYNFADEDYRKNFYALVRSIDGFEITISISQDQASDGSNTIDLLTKDWLYQSEIELWHRSAEIISTLRSFGLEIGKVESSEIDRPPRKMDENQIKNQAWANVQLDNKPYEKQ